MIWRALFGLFLLSLLALPAQGQPTNQNTRVLSLKECIEIALDHNLDIQVARYSPQLARYRLQGSYGVFDPILTLRGEDDWQDQPGLPDEKKLQQVKAITNVIFVPIDSRFVTNVYTTNTIGHEWPNENRFASAWSSVQGTLPMGGLSYNLFAGTTNYQATTFVLPYLQVPQNGFPPAFNNPSSNNFSSIVGITLTQPVLKDSWIDRDRRNIQLNKKNLQISELALSGELMSNVTFVATVYYRLIFAREEVHVQTAALQSAKQLVEDSRRKVEVGVLAPLDLKQAEANFETVQTQLFAAEQNHTRRQHELKDLLTEDYQSWIDLTIVPSENLEAVVELPANVAVSRANALLRRPDLLQRRLELEKLGIILAFTYNQLFPSLNLIGTYGWQSTEHTFGESWTTVAHGSDPFFSAAGVLSFPVANVTARSEYQASGLVKKQALLQFKRLQQSIVNEVDTAVKLTDTTFKQVGSARKARQFAEAALSSVQKQYDAGTLTSFFVVDAQRRFALARFTEIRALAEHNIALARLALSEGTVLEKNHLDLKLK